MPVKHAIWRVDGTPQSLPLTKLPSEQLLEEMILREPSSVPVEYASLLMSYETIMPLKLPSNLTDPDLAEAIRTKGKRVLGGIDMILAKATRLAIREGTEKVTLDLVNRVNYGGPKIKTRADLA